MIKVVFGCQNFGVLVINRLIIKAFKDPKGLAFRKDFFTPCLYQDLY